MEREPTAGRREHEPIEPEDATPQEEPEDLPTEPGRLPDTGHVAEKKEEEDGSEG